MENGSDSPASIDEYIRGFPEEVQAILQEVRATIKKAVPDALETISYRMPAFTRKGMLLYFAAFKHHVGLYPTASGIEAFRDEFSGYKSSKGAVQFPMGKSMPLELIARIARHRADENERRSLQKKKAGKGQ